MAVSLLDGICPHFLEGWGEDVNVKMQSCEVQLPARPFQSRLRKLSHVCEALPPS